MPEESIPNEGSHNITVQDAIRLKHALGKSITWGNSSLNALEVEELTRLGSNDYAEIRKDYAKWHASTWSSYVLFAVIIGCIIGYSTARYGWLRIAAVVIGITCFYVLCKREGHAEGYIEGYEAGHETGIYKTLGIKKEEIGEMAKTATDMKIDEMLVKSMEDRKAKEAGQDARPQQP